MIHNQSESIFTSKLFKKLRLQYDISAIASRKRDRWPGDLILMRAYVCCRTEESARNKCQKCISTPSGGRKMAERLGKPAERLKTLARQSRRPFCAI